MLIYQCYYRELERNKNENYYNIVLPNENCEELL